MDVFVVAVLSEAAKDLLLVLLYLHEAYDFTTHPIFHRMPTDSQCLHHISTFLPAGTE
jgi:hypothetical protein